MDIIDNGDRFLLPLGSKIEIDKFRICGPVAIEVVEREWGTENWWCKTPFQFGIGVLNFLVSDGDIRHYKELGMSLNLTQKKKRRKKS